MRIIILVALLILLVTVVGCKDNESMPTENTMNSMDMDSVEKSKSKMQQSVEGMEAPAAGTEAPASREGAGTAQ